MLKIVKIGGNIVDNPAKLRAFLADFAALDGDKILVHGGGKVATAISAALGIETTMIEGRRVTDVRTLEVVTMVYNGINKQIVSILQSLGCNAVGLCGADGRLIASRRRAPEPVDYGFVGDPVAVNTVFARSLVAAGCTLVIAPITLDDAIMTELSYNEMVAKIAASDAGVEIRTGTDPETRGDRVAGSNALLNTNADTVAQTLAVAMAGGVSVSDAPATVNVLKYENYTNICNIGKNSAEVCNTENNGPVELIYCFEKQGVMLNMEDENSVIPRIDRARFAELKISGAVHSGMLPKLENAFRALEKGVEKVVICAAENIARPGYGGTIIVK